MDEYLKRKRNDNWDDEECRDNKEFLKVKEELWSKMYPMQESTGAEQIDVDVLPDNIDEAKADMLSGFLDGDDMSDSMNLPLPKVPEKGEL